SQRKKIISALDDSLSIIPADDRNKSHDLSKYAVVVSAGLFDGALNYLWDETVRAFRHLIITFDSQYFYAIAENINSRYKNLAREEDIDQVSDHDLFEICRRMGLLSDVKYQWLEHANYIRKSADTDHLNYNDADASEILEWLSSCLKHAITSIPDHSLLVVKELFNNIRTGIIPTSDYPVIGESFSKQPIERIDDFLRAIFDLYTTEQTTTDCKNNILGIASYVWGFSSENIKYEIGAKFGLFRKNSERARENLCQEFLQSVNGLTYKDEDSLASEIIEKLKNLNRAHFGPDNLYNELPHAEALFSLHPNGSVPRAARPMWVKVISMCYVGNGYGFREGVDEVALPYYIKHINNFKEPEIIDFIKLFSDSEFVSKITRKTPDKRARNMAEVIEETIMNAHIVKSLDLIISGPASELHEVHKSAAFKDSLKYLSNA
ncbi:hypothetical protein JYT26_02810, partial [Beggiatoa alba]|nr:hypothetical protein [Beggiatoa alba]